MIVTDENKNVITCCNQRLEDGSMYICPSTSTSTSTSRSVSDKLV